MPHGAVEHVLCQSQYLMQLLFLTESLILICLLSSLARIPKLGAKCL